MSGQTHTIPGRGACPYCSSSFQTVVHGSGGCPRVRAIEYYPDGAVKRVELVDLTRRGLYVDQNVAAVERALSHIPPAAEADERPPTRAELAEAIRELANGLASLGRQFASTGAGSEDA